MLHSQLPHREEFRRVRVPPPSRQDDGGSSRSLESLSQQVEEVLNSVSDVLATISVKHASNVLTTEKIRQVGRRRATLPHNETNCHPLTTTPSEQRSASLELGAYANPSDKSLKRKPLPTTARLPAPRRPCGLRRPSLQGSSPLQGQTSKQQQAFQPSTSRPIGLAAINMDSSAFLHPRAVPSSPSISPSSPSFDFTFSMPTGSDESDASAASFPQRGMASASNMFQRQSGDALETGWRWDESGRCSPAANRRPQTTPPSTFASRPRKASLRNILTRTPSSSRPVTSGLGPIGPIEQPFVPGEVSPVNTGHRSTMDWDSSDDESFSTKLRVSFGKNSLKKSKVVTMFRRNSTD